MTRVAKQCLNYSITLIKINFVFILVLQTMKLFTGMTDAMHRDNISHGCGGGGGNAQAALSSSLNGLPTTTNSTNALTTTFLRFLTHLWSSNTYDVNLMEATKTEVVNVYDNPTAVASALMDKSASKTAEAPLVTFHSFINFTEFIQFNNLKNMIKLAFVLNLNLTTLIVNLVVVSYLLVKDSAHYRLAGVRFARSFMKANLALNLTILIVLLALNTAYLFVFSDYFKKHSSLSTANAYMHDYINNVFHTDNLTRNFGAATLPNVSDYTLVELNSRLAAAVEFSGPVEKSSASHVIQAAASIVGAAATINNSSFNSTSRAMPDGGVRRLLATLNVKLNLTLMVGLILLLTFYSYFLNDDDTSEDDDVETDKKPCYYVNTSDVDEKQLLLRSDSDDDDENTKSFVTLKKKKCFNEIEYNLLWIIHSLLIIYVLSIWDISDVYQYFKMQNWENTNLNMLRQASAMDQNELILRHILSNSSMSNELSRLHEANSTGGDAQMSVYTDFSSNYSDHFYAHSFMHARLNEYTRHRRQWPRLRHNDSSHDLSWSSSYGELTTTTYDEEYKTTTTIRVLFILKMHSKLLSCVLVALFSALVLYRLARIESLLELDFERLMRDNLAFRRKFLSLDI